MIKEDIFDYHDSMLMNSSQNYEDYDNENNNESQEKIVNESHLKQLEDSMELAKIEKFIDRQKVSFVCSVDSESFPNVKAMLKPRGIEGIQIFYFSTNTSSMRAIQYINNPNACIYFYHKGLIKYVGVMLKGKMEVLTDQETKDMIWRKGDTLFYKGGVTDPDYCVLKFTAESGRYYCDLKTESFTIEQE